MTGCIPGIPLGNFLINLERGKTTREIRMPSETNSASVNEDCEPSPVPLAKGKSRRVSARDFFDELNVALTNFDDLAAQTNTWEMVLASGASGENEKMDVLLIGQEDG